MINHEHNRRFLNIYLLLRDNGTVTISTFMRIIVLHPSIQEMEGITLFFSDAPYLIMTNSTVFLNYIINNEIEGNESGVANLIIPQLVFTSLSQCRKNIQENIAIVNDH